MNRDFILHFVKRAEKSGFHGFIVTVDQAILSKRPYRTEDGENYEYINKYSCENLEKSIRKWIPDMHAADAFVTYIDGNSDWGDIDWLKSITNLPVIVKGILTAEMAVEALEHDVDGIIVSNHGARQIDDTFATIDALPEVVKAVNGRCDVYMDGGIRKGTDVAKAIALGAKAVFVGRPVLWGLACNGKEGAQKVIEILKDEFIEAMQLLGVTTIKDLQTTPNIVVHERKLLSRL